MAHIVEFDSEQALDHQLVGGKAKNLGALTKAGFSVPRGFVVSTTAYTDFLERTGLAQWLRDTEKEFQYDDADRLEEQAGAVRDAILSSELPADIATTISTAYATLGQDAYVAVRSSGTAEDLADASFAGQHDTYLDIRTTEGMLDAVRRCWASLWSTRAVAYRQRGGYEHSSAQLAVVVQTMVESECAGVMFTANPFTGATSEIVINSSWGLGEGVVSGIVTPDQYTLAKPTLAIRDHVLGTKQVQVVRDPANGRGTVEQPVQASMQSAWSLSDDAVRELAELGRRVEQAYEGMPQDIEWAYAGEEFFVLQARDVTGVEMTWDEDVDAWQTLPDDDEVIWTRGFADEFWTGAITPLFYSVRAREMTECNIRIAKEWGFEDLASKRRHRYHKAEAYISNEYQKALVKNTTPKQFQAAQVGYLPEGDQKAVLDAPFSLAGYLRMHARIVGLTPGQGITKWFGVLEDYMKNRQAEADGLSANDLRLLSDEALFREIDQNIALATELLYAMWSGFFVHGSTALTLLGTLLGKWYDGPNEMILADLITGLPQRTTTLTENLQQWELAEEVRNSPEVRQLFENSGKAEFFDALAELPAGAKAHAKYQQILSEHGHRGHADRDFWFARRLDDPSIDHQMLTSLLSSDGSMRPEEAEAKLIAAREAATEDVVSRLRNQPFGSIRVEIFRVLLSYTHRFLVLRDDERHYMDRITYTKKRGFVELGRRLYERGQLEQPDDFYFLSQAELYDLLQRRAPLRLTQAKIKGRRAAFDRFDSKEEMPPYFLKGNTALPDTDADATDDSSGVLSGMGTSRGSVTGTARVIKDLKDIGRVHEGDILITNSTDPAWTPVFLVIKGLVLETGGLLAHGSCLSREYSLPAVTVSNAIARIPDGATITVDGTNGAVHLHLDESAEHEGTDLVSVG